MPMEILGLEVQREHVRQDGVQGGGNLCGCVRLEVCDRIERLDPPKFCFSKVHGSCLLLVQCCLLLVQWCLLLVQWGCTALPRHAAGTRWKRRGDSGSKLLTFN